MQFSYFTLACSGLVFLGMVGCREASILLSIIFVRAEMHLWAGFALCLDIWLECLKAEFAIIDLNLEMLFRVAEFGFIMLVDVLFKHNYGAFGF